MVEVGSYSDTQGTYCFLIYQRRVCGLGYLFVQLDSTWKDLDTWDTPYFFFIDFLFVVLEHFPFFFLLLFYLCTYYTITQVYLISQLLEDHNTKKTHSSMYQSHCAASWRIGEVREKTVNNNSLCECLSCTLEHALLTYLGTR